MSPEKNQFEKRGLKIDKERILIFSGLVCPLDCKYCFVGDLDSNQQNNGISYLSKEQYDLLSQLPPEINLVMLGCDTEFFQSKSDSLKLLDRLVVLRKDLSVVTKLRLSEGFIRKLREIDQKLRTQGNFLALSMSIPCIDSAKIWEPKAPTPQSRIDTLKTVYEAGIQTLVAIRPLLPTISHGEIEDIVRSTHNYCRGYYSGPLYLKTLDPTLLDCDSPDLNVEKLQPHWMLDGNFFYKIEKIGQMECLRTILKKYGKILFEGAAEAVEFLRENAEH